MTLKKNEFGLDNLSYEKSGDEVSEKGNIETKISVDEKESTERVKWGNDLQFLMSCIAMSVGLGNIWRFPFTAYENGGGAFLIPYIIVLLIIGRPFYYLEMALGQFTSRGTVKMFEALAPAMKGVGYAQVLGTICVATYYCALMALTLFYLANSFTGDLPWATCWPEWEEELALENRTCVASEQSGEITSNNTVSSSELYFLKEVLNEPSSIEDGIGAPDWRLTLCLLASWIMTFLVSRSGVQSAGKFSYFLALFPYVVMITLLVKACTLEGAVDGIIFFFNPQWDKLATAKVWYAAVTQCFFSLSVGFGPIIMYSSYNDFSHNINRDALVVTTLDTFTSLLAGTTIFGILGNLAHELGVEVPDVINSGGTALAFISYPDAISKFDAVPWLFSILFFVMLLVLSIGSLVGLQNCVITVIMDAFPKLKDWHVAAMTSIVGFIIGLVYVTPGGQYILNLVDYFGGTFVIFIGAICEIVGVVWWYGLENFCIDMEFMLKRKVNIYWRLMWGLITPLALIIIFIYFLVTIERLTYGEYEYPDSAIICGWMILVVALAQGIMWTLYYIYVNRRLGCTKMVSQAFTTENWGPQTTERIEEYKKFREMKQQEFLTKYKTRPRRIIATLFGR